MFMQLTLICALKLTFENNTELKAERENIRSSKEVLNISKSDFLPTMTLTGSKSFEKQINLQIKVVKMHLSQMLIHFHHQLKLNKLCLDGQGREC